MPKKHKTNKQRLIKMRGCSKKTKKNMKGGCGCGVKLFGGSRKYQKGGMCGVCGGLKGGCSCKNKMLCEKNSCPFCHGLKGQCICNKKGGDFYKQGYPVPAPLVGDPWGPKVIQWPGVDGIDYNRNYFANNLYNHGDPQTAMQLQSGGGFLPQDLVNFGRNISFSANSAYNALRGVPQPTNPNPYMDQLTR